MSQGSLLEPLFVKYVDDLNMNEGGLIGGFVDVTIVVGMVGRGGLSEAAIASRPMESLANGIYSQQLPDGTFWEIKRVAQHNIYFILCVLCNNAQVLAILSDCDLHGTGKCW